MTFVMQLFCRRQRIRHLSRGRWFPRWGARGRVHYSGVGCENRQDVNPYVKRCPSVRLPCEKTVKRKAVALLYLILDCFLGKSNRFSARGSFFGQTAREFCFLKRVLWNFYKSITLFLEKETKNARLCKKSRAAESGRVKRPLPAKQPFRKNRAGDPEPVCVSERQS